MSTTPLLEADRMTEVEAPITGAGGQTDFDNKAMPSGYDWTKNQAVITSTPVVEKAQANIQALDNLKQQPTGLTSENVFTNLAASGKGSITDSLNGKIFTNTNGDVFDMSGKKITTAPVKDTGANAVTAAMGGTVLQDGEREIFAPDGTKLIVDKDGNIRQSEQSNLKIENKYLAGRNIKEFSELSPSVEGGEIEDPTTTDTNNKLDEIYNRADERTKSRIASIKQMVESSVKAQTEANKAVEGGTFNIGITSGRSRYAPDIQMGIMQNQVNVGLSKIADLQAKGEQLILEAEEARDEQQFKVLSKKMEEYRLNKKQMFDETIATQKLAMDLEKAAVENKKTTLENVKLAREEATANAEDFAGAMLPELETMTQQEQEEYINKTAEESGLFDAVSLKTAIDNRKRVIAAEQAKGVSSYMADWKALGGQVGTGKTFQEFYASQQAAERVPTTASTISDALASNTPVFNAVQNISQNLASKNADSFISNVNRNMASGNVAGAKESILNASILAVPNAADQSKAMGRVVTLDLLDTIKNDLEQFTSKNGDTNIFKGTAEQVANNILGMTTNPELARLATKIQATIQNYRQFVSGAAFTDKETKEYVNLFPSTKKTGELNIANIKGLQSIYRTALNSQLGLIMGAQSYRELFGKEGAFSGVSGQIQTGTDTAAPQTKVVDGVTYIKVEGGWKKQ